CFLGATGCGGTPAPVVSAGCTKDTDCKGDRICERGTCVAPPPVVAVPDAPVAGHGPPTPPYAMARGGPRHLGRLAGAAPVHAPAPVWSVAVGDAIVAGPTVGPDGTIYVGSHDGHLRAITPDGKEKWSFATGDRIWTTPAVTVESTIYVGSDD